MSRLARGMKLGRVFGLCCFIMLALAHRASAEEPPVVFLHTEFLPYARPIPNPLSTRLFRELVRQSVLIAARDEMGCAVRDESLQEEDPLNATVVHIMPRERGDQEGKWKFKLISAEEGTQWETTFEVPGGGQQRFVEFVRVLEDASRGSLLEGLRASDVTGTKKSSGDQVPPDAEIQALLDRPDVIAQFTAVRAAHAAISERGESAEWLGVLVRGYANLGLLTRHYWNAAPEVFTARAWLYAQRLAATTQARDLALWHRAYAWAWGGMLPPAMADLEAADAEHPAGDGGRTADVSRALPAWVRLTRAYCQFDRDAIQRVTEECPALQAWGAVLRFTIANFEWNERQMLADAHDIGKACPAGCLFFGELAVHGSLTQLPLAELRAMPRYFAREVPRAVAAMPGLPPSVRQIIEQGLPPNRPDETITDSESGVESFSPLPMATARQLRAESATITCGEPSWSGLAYLLEEEQFLQVWHHLAGVRRDAQRLVAPDAEKLMPLISDHRYAAYIESFRYDFQIQATEVLRGWRTIRIVDPRASMYYMFFSLRGVRDQVGTSRGEEAYSQISTDLTVHGISEVLTALMALGTLQGDYLSETLVKQVQDVAPKSDRHVHLSILAGENPTHEQLAEWETQLHDNPAAWTDLAIRYQVLGDHEGVVRCCQKSMDIAPTYLALETLSHFELQDGDATKWEEKMVAALPSLDLEKDRLALHGLLARQLADRGHWQRALPHAVICGESGSPFGLGIAGTVTEALARWEESERWMRQLAERYAETHATSWYFWCERNGRGDLDAARRLAEKYLAVGVRTTSNEAADDGVYQWVRGSRQLGLQAFRRVWTLDPRPFHAFLVAQLARSSRNESLRSEILEAVAAIVAKPGDVLDPSQRAANEAALAVLEFLRSANASPEMLHEIDRRLLAAPPTARGEFACIVGLELAALGKTDEAEVYWLRALANPGVSHIHGTLAGWELTKRRITARDDQGAFRDGEIWPVGKAKVE